ncbi:LysM peptidoglycan-binding domain-containing protein, partial [Rhizobiaceae sp. 2RAB30]
MRFSILKVNGRFLARGAAVIVVGGLATGCSSSAMRFGDGVDGIFTASTDNQRSIIRQPSQPYPGDTQASAVDASPTGSVARAAAAPVGSAGGSVSRGELAPPSGTVAARPTQPAPKQMAALTPPDRGTVEAAKSHVAAAAEEEVAGWSRAGGTQITAKEGETVYNLSRRFGVPADVLMKVNGLSGASTLKSGQKLVIPTYVYSSKSPVSAPDNDPKVADAKSSRGMKSDIPADKLPAPTDKVAVLPQGPKVKDGDPAPASAAPAAAANAKPDASGSYTVQQGDTLAAIS